MLYPVAEPYPAGPLATLRTSPWNSLAMVVGDLSVACTLPTIIQDYTYVGVISGKFYDENGRARPEKAAWIARQLEVAHAEEVAKERNKKAAPNCRKRWTQKDGTLCGSWVVKWPAPHVAFWKQHFLYSKGTSYGCGVVEGLLGTAALGQIIEHSGTAHHFCGCAVQDSMHFAKRRIKLCDLCN